MFRDFESLFIHVKKNNHVRIEDWSIIIKKIKQLIFEKKKKWDGNLKKNFSPFCLVSCYLVFNLEINLLCEFYENFIAQRKVRINKTAKIKKRKENLKKCPLGNSVKHFKVLCFLFVNGIYIYIYIYIYIRVCVRMYLWMCVCVCVLQLYTRTSLCIYIYIYILGCQWVGRMFSHKRDYNGFLCSNQSLVISFLL